MRVIGSSSAIVALIAATSAWSQAPSRVEPSRKASGRLSSRADTDVVSLFRFEPTGLSLLQPYQRGKIPVVFVHGLWANPWSWSRMIESLEADPALRDRYQFWTFGYSTGDPIPYSAVLLRRDLDEVRRKFDPDGTDCGVRPDGPRRPQHGRPADQDDGPGQRDPAVAAHQRSARRRARGRAGRSRPLPPRPVLQAPSGGPPRGLHRHAAPGEPRRPGRAGAPRLTAHPPPRPTPGVLRAAHGPQWPGLLHGTLPQGPAHQHRRTGVAVADPHAA